MPLVPSNTPVDQKQFQERSKGKKPASVRNPATAKEDKAKAEKAMEDNIKANSSK